MIIGIAGLSHLGLVTAVGLAEKGFQIVAWDPNTINVEELKAGNTTISEPQLTELLSKNTNNIKFVRSCSELRNADLVYIASDTPTDNTNSSDLLLVNKIIADVINCLEKDTILVILSQVPPGFTKSLDIPGCRLFYQVETLVLGEAVNRFLSPERFIIGCSNASKEIHPKLAKVLKKFNCPVLTMSYESAEIAKIAINSILASQVSTTNMLSALCESIGADWSEIVPALRLDKRIGKKAYLKPGLGLAGGNLERDLSVLDDLTAQYKIENTQIKGWLKNSNIQKNWLHRKFSSLDLDKRQDPKVALLGLAYKENTNSIKNSSAIHFLNQIKGYNVYVHDPVVKLLNTSWLKQVDNSTEALKNADVLILATPWPEYQNLKLKTLQSLMKRPIIIDPSSLFSNQNPSKYGFKWIRLGATNQSDS
jgi:UDPglucose 6-dehydrogenase